MSLGETLLKIDEYIQPFTELTWSHFSKHYSEHRASQGCDWVPAVMIVPGFHEDLGESWALWPLPMAGRRRERFL